MADAEQRTQAPHVEQLTEAERLKRDYESRRAGERPISHSVAVAYRQLIARSEAQQHSER